MRTYAIKNNRYTNHKPIGYLYHDEIAFLEKHEGRCDKDDYKIVMVKGTS